MQTHNVQPNTKSKTKKLVGRGGVRGKTSGRGHKGQKARSGNSTRPAVRDLIKKLPKLRGYRFNSRHTKPQVVNVSDLETAFAAGDTISVEALAEKGLIAIKKGATSTPVKILGDGELSKKLTITSGITVSTSARDKITKAGGSISE